MIELEVPILKCVPHNLTAEPFGSIERLERFQKLLTLGSATPVPIAVNNGDKFIIVRHWDFVKYSSSDKSRIRILVLEDHDDHPLYYCITQHVSDLNLNWAHIALAVSKAKSELKYTDEKLANILKIDRSTIARYNRIVSKLSHKLFELAKSGKITYSECRRLISLSKDEQFNLLDRINARSWSVKTFVNEALPGSKTIKVRSSAERKTDKPRDILKLENAISEAIGFPVTINNSNNSGTIEYEFFDRITMLEVITKIRTGFNKDARPKGKIVISYDNLDEFSQLIDGFTL